MNLHERVLSVLGCRFVDDVLIDAPYQITPEMITSLNIAEVVRGTVQGVSAESAVKDEEERYQYAKEAGIFKVITVPHTFRIGTVIQRIQRNHEAFQAKFERKMEAERQYSVTNGSSHMNAMQ
jgi:ethanolamine-phosphate cytidylyltransferase